MSVQSSLILQGSHVRVHCSVVVVFLFGIIGSAGCVVGEGEEIAGLDGGLRGNAFPNGRGGFTGPSLPPLDASASAMECAPVDEICNQMDDDCDGQVDEGFRIGEACMVNLGGCDAVGVLACNPTNNRVTQCAVENEPIARAEECNGLDDDCDGAVDENFPEPCGACVADVEVCNQEDDDCDGAVDENLGANSPEVCNAADDDCDGDVDEGAACPCPTAIHQGRIYLFCGALVPDQPEGFGRRNEWQASRDLCESIGFHLVKVDNQAEDGFVYQTLAGLGFGDTWMGMNDLQTDMTWVWHDGDGLTYVNWDDGEPNGRRDENCGIMLVEEASRASRWDDRPCDRDYHFVCEAMP